jgi:hypothetical protein
VDGCGFGFYFDRVDGLDSQKAMVWMGRELYDDARRERCCEEIFSCLIKDGLCSLRAHRYIHTSSV